MPPLSPWGRRPRDDLVDARRGASPRRRNRRGRSRSRRARGGRAHAPARRDGRGDDEYGGRTRRARKPTVPASAFSVRPIWSLCSQPGSGRESAWVNVWFPSSKSGSVKPADELGVADDLAADDEERGRDVQPPERRGDARCPARVGAVVEGERDSLAGPPPRVASCSPSQVRIGPADASGPEATGAGVALRPVVRVESP